MKKSTRFRSFDAFLRSKHGEKVHKIPLDAGATCPNRDGTLSNKGCTFCNEIGSGSGLGHLGIPQQWAHWRERFAAADRLKNTRLFLAYFQAFTNTYGPATRLQQLINQLNGLDGIIGLAVGTRPDCVDEEKLAILASAPFPEIWLELGVQSLRNASLAAINRGHSAETSLTAIALAGHYPVSLCVHLMLGLPGETKEDFLATVRTIAALPIHGVKLHGLYVPEGTQLAASYHAGQYRPLTLPEYLDWVCEALTLLPSAITIHRLTGDPAPGELIAPDWANSKGQVLQAIDRRLIELDIWQGCKADVPDANPFEASV